MKTRKDWGPADEMANDFSNGAALIVGAIFLFAFGYGTVSAGFSGYAWLTQIEQRGFIKCQAGGVSVGNIQIDAPVKPGKALIDLDAVDCTKSQ